MALRKCTDEAISILHMPETGCRWREVPPENGPATMAYGRMPQEFLSPPSAFSRNPVQ